MLELDRHLSQSLEQARHAPLNVQRYGRSWVWVLSSDAWRMRRAGRHWMVVRTHWRRCEKPSTCSCGPGPRRR